MKNFYGSKRHKLRVQELDEELKNCDLVNPMEEKELSDGYIVKSYYLDSESKTVPLYTAPQGKLFRLYNNDILIYEWKNTYDKHLWADIIKHSNGNTYLVFDEELYGYSVLELETMKSIHYIPFKSYRYGDKFEETFIWADVHYNPYNNYLAVGGCFWACPYSVIVLDFSKPLEIVYDEKWVDVRSKIDPEYEKYEDIDFQTWNENILTLQCEDAENSRKRKRNINIYDIL